MGKWIAGIIASVLATVLAAWIISRYINPPTPQTPPIPPITTPPPPVIPPVHPVLPEETIHLYAKTNGSVSSVQEETVCIIQISHGGHATKVDAQNASSYITFHVTLNGSELPRSGNRGYFSTPGQWHLFQQFKTPPLKRGNYQVHGVSFEKKNQVDQRTITIRVK